MTVHNLQDVAKYAGVSKATASRVLNGSQQVHPDTRRRGLAAMAESAAPVSSSCASWWA
jgi:DNA-binding LacI/PurR family transcriptional regulator